MAGLALAGATLDNGLRVVAAPDRSSPLTGVAIVYDVGFRSEPEGRTGFAHLFEHLMFQGSSHVAKMEHARLIQTAGGTLNGHTLPDLTAYYQVVPSSEMELALWLEADRMSSLAVTEENLRNQVAVVEEEIKVNVLNRPYGGFPWIPLPALAFDTYPNAHNGYGDFAHLEDATVEDAVTFYRRFYSPSNAVLVVAGDCDPDEVMALAERHFGAIARRRTPRRGPYAEPPLKEERRRVIDDPLVPQPAVVAGYRVPDPVADLDGYAARVVLASLLGEGDASRLRQRLLYHDQVATDVACLLGAFGRDAFYMRDPVLFQVLIFHPGVVGTDQLLRSLDEELSRLAEDGPTATELAKVGAQGAAEHWHAFDVLMERAVELASVQTIHGRAELVLDLPEKLAAVDAPAVAAAAADLLAQHRAVLELRPARR